VALLRRYSSCLSEYLSLGAKEAAGLGLGVGKTICLIWGVVKTTAPIIITDTIPITASNPTPVWCLADS
jgi:hypothetical protein